MHKFVIIILLLFPVVLEAQNALTFGSADSLTYRCYLSGDWNQLIETGEQAIAQNIDFKWLRQRMGYAYFVKQDYYASQKQYEKAFAFDENDPITCEYLYYCGLNTGNLAYARFYAAKLPNELKKTLGIHAFNPIASVDVEYNYKYNNITTRSNPAYYRAGIYTQTGYRVSIYQSASDYKQTVNSVLIKQPEYFALINWSVTSHISLSLAYHHLNTSLDGYQYPGNLVYGLVSTRLSRYSLGLNGSSFKYNLGNFTQIGVQGGVTMPGKSGLYFMSYLSGLIDNETNRLIFSQYAGARIFKSLWAEGNVTLGNIQNYQDHNALYIYNSVDPTLFRTGLSLYWYIGKHVTLYGNYLYDTKQVEQTTDQYIQHSYLGGLIWQL